MIPYFAGSFLASGIVVIVLIARVMPRARIEVAKRHALAQGNGVSTASVSATVHVAAAQAGNIFLRFLAKLLRRMKVLSLKLENTSTRLMHRTQEKSRKITLSYEDWRTERQGLPKISFDASFITDIEGWFEGFYRRYFRRGVGYERAAVRDDLAPREKSLVAAILSDPKNTAAYKELGLYYFEKGNMADALAAFEAIRKIDPTNSEAAERVAHIRGVAETSQQASNTNGKPIA